MIEIFFRDPHVIARLRRPTPLAGGLDELAAHLHRRGHALVVGRDYLRAAAHLGHWMRAARIPLGALREEVVERFLRKHMPRCRCSIPRGLPLRVARASLGHLVAVLRTSGRIPPRETSKKTASDIVVAEYRQYLYEMQGAAQRTIDTYSGHASEFLVAMFGTKAVDLSEITASELIAFVDSHAGRWRPKTTKLLTTVLRNFLRFMEVQGLCDNRLVNAVPIIPEWKLASVPKVLSEDQLRTLLSVFDRDTDVGRRDYAITVCLCQLALRASEVAGLRIDDFDWRSGVVQVVGKSRRACRLPVPAAVGSGVAKYLRDGRPKSSSRHVFVRHCVPLGEPIDACAVRSIIRRALAKTGMKVSSKGTHVLRHTAATRMVRAGASLKEVADVLRHRSLDTTAIYTKVDLPRLAAVALPWPKVQS